MGARPAIKDVRDSTTISMLRDAYRPGTKVEAVKVKNIAAGTIGVVKGVKASGGIEVLWNTGEIGEVEFGLDSIKIVNGGKCMVKRKPDDQACVGDRCSECGWNEEVHKERIKRIRNGEMVTRKTEKGEESFLQIKKKKRIPVTPELLNSKK